MRSDIVSREDLFIIVSDFYIDLMASKGLSHFFVSFKDEKVLKHHLDTLVDFWDNILFYSGSYKKNAMKPHLDLHPKKPFEKQHFQQWILHFNTTIDENFIGEVAHAAKSRALSIATVMQIKISELNKT